ncbi:MAG TPA: hypothetical protein VEI80_03425, partial [Candidatus Acidoferrales bacterium]|nr:hypothetical protein [Candidatus Acidoferrales bacterium]
MSKKDAGVESKSTAKLKKLLVDPSLTVQPEIQVPEPNFGWLSELTPFRDGFFHHPVTLNPAIA